VSGPHKLVSSAAAITAFGFLVAMVLSGAQPVQRQLASFEPKGVLQIPPAQVHRIDLRRGAERITLVRTGETTWATPEGKDVRAETGKRISMAVQMMHTSGPARRIAPEELTSVDVTAFELDPPRLSVTLYGREESPLLTARFGGHNPDEFFQFMRIDGDPSVYLMSRFVGEEWTNVANGTSHE
jgi:hypothetical protein